jgi:hypothetical protein
VGDRLTFVVQRTTKVHLAAFNINKKHNALFGIISLSQSSKGEKITDFFSF